MNGERHPLIVVRTVLVLGALSGAHADEGAEDPAPPRIGFAEAVRRTLDRNPQATVANQEIRRAEALVREVRAAALPSLTGVGAYTRLNADRVLGDRVIAAADSLNLSLYLSAPLFAPHAWAQLWHAQDAVGVARSAAADVQRQLALAVGHAYLTVLAQARVVVATRVARDAARAHFDFAHARRAGGVGNRIDEVRAQQELFTDEAQLQTALALLARAREGLGVLVGSDGPLDVVEEPTLSDPQSLGETLEAAGRRADVLAAAERHGAARHVSRDNWADYAPLLSGTFQPFYQNPASLTLPTVGWQAQLVLSIPLYDGGFRYGQARERAALTAEARAALEGTLRQSRSDVRAAFETVRRADRALAAATEAGRLNHEALDLASLAYRAGATTNLEVIDAQRRARDADTAVAAAEDSARQARLDLLSAAGKFP